MECVTAEKVVAAIASQHNADVVGKKDWNKARFA
jgi:hypothetical protein